MTSPRPSQCQERTDAGVSPTASGAGHALRLAEPQRTDAANRSPVVLAPPPSDPPPLETPSQEGQPESGVYPRLTRRAPATAAGPPRRRSKWPWFGLLCLCLIVLGALSAPRALEFLELTARRHLDARLTEGADLRVAWNGLAVRWDGVYLKQLLLRNNEQDATKLRIEANDLRVNVHWVESLLAGRFVVSASRIDRAILHWHEATSSPSQSAPSFDQVLDPLWNGPLSSVQIDSLSVHVEPHQSPALSFEVSNVRLLRRARSELDVRATIDDARVAERSWGSGWFHGVLADDALRLEEVTWRSEFGRAEAQASINLDGDATPSEVSGTIHLEPSLLPGLVNQHARSGFSLEQVAQASMTFRGRGFPFDPGSWNLEGQARLDSARLHLEARGPGAGSAVELKRVDVHLQHEPGETRCHFSARAPGANLAGNARWAGDDVELYTRAQLKHLRWIRSVAATKPLSPYVETNPRLPFDLQVDVTARRAGGRWSADGTLDVAHLVLQTPHHTGPIDALRSTWHYEPGRPLRIEQLSLKSPAGKLSGKGWINDREYSLRIHADTVDLRSLDRWVPGVLQAGVGSGTFQVHGSLERFALRARGELQLARLKWQPPASLSAKLSSAELDAIHTHFDWHDGRLSLSNLRGRGRVETSQGSVSGGWDGWLSLTPEHLRWGVQVEPVEARLLGLLVPGAWHGGSLRVSLRGAGTRSSPLTRIEGHAELHDARWQPSMLTHDLQAMVGESGVRVNSGSASFAYSPNQWRVEGLQLHSSLGRFGATAHGDFEQHRVELELEPAAPDWLGPLVPGHISAGRWQLRATLRGTNEQPLQRLTGRASVRDGRWSAPSEAPWCNNTFELAHGTTAFSWDGRRLHLTRMQLETDRLRAQGELLHTVESTFVDAQLATHRAGEVLSLLPELRGVLRGGSGIARVRLRETERGTAGVVEGRIDGGTLVVASLNPAKSETHPIDTTRFEYEFGSAWQRLRNFTLRGPELNVDLDVGWFDAGSLQGQGRAWLTRPYTQRLAKGAGLLLDILGYRRISSRFHLSGSPRFVRMQADIVRDWQWQLLQVAIPKDVAKVARGDKPLLATSEPGGPTPTCH